MPTELSTTKSSIRSVFNVSLCKRNCQFSSVHTDRQKTSINPGPGRNLAKKNEKYMICWTAHVTDKQNRPKPSKNQRKTIKFWGVHLIVYLCVRNQKNMKNLGVCMFGTPKNTGLRISVDRWKWTVEKSTTKTDPVCCFGIRESAQVWTPWQCDTISNSKPPAPALWLDSWLPQFDLVQCGMFRDIS